MRLRGILQIFVAALTGGALLALVWHVAADNLPSREAKSQNEVLISRQWLEYAESIIRHETKTPPPAAARFYAYVATAYSDTLSATHDQIQASQVTADIIDVLYPVYSHDTSQARRRIAPKSAESSNYGQAASGVFEHLLERSKHDGFQLTGGTKPPGTTKAYWLPNPYPPVTPRAGEWQTWLVGDIAKFSVAPPPVFGSAQDARELQLVIDAAALH